MTMLEQGLSSVSTTIYSQVRRYCIGSRWSSRVATPFLNVRIPYSHRQKNGIEVSP